LHKKLLMFLLLGMFLISLTSAEVFTFDNQVSYDNYRKDVQIKDLFGLGKHYADIKITSHEDLDKPIYVGTGWQRVIIQEINGKKDYNDFIGKPRFKNMKNGNEEELDYYWEKAIYGDVEVNDYKQVCELVNDKNGTSYNSCNQVLNGTHIENKIIDWERFDKKDIKKNEKITIALVVNVKAGDYYDGIPKFFGKEIKEWASWSNDLTNGIVAYYQMNETSPSTTMPEYFNGIYDITVGDNWISGLIGNGYDIGTDSSTRNTGFNQDSASEITYAVWVYRTGTWPDAILTDTATKNAINGDWYMGRGGSDKAFSFVVTDGTSSKNQRNDLKNVPLNDWTLIVFRANASQYCTAMNGTEFEHCVGLDGSFNPNNQDILLKDTSSGSWGNIYFDEAGFWNRRLTDSELDQLYNDGNGITPPSPPLYFTPTIISPTATTYTTNTHDLTYTFTNTSLTDSCWYSKDNGQTNSSRVDCGTNWTSLTANEGSNTWTVYGNLTDGTLGNDTVTFTVDTTPMIKFSGATPDDYTNQSFNTIQIKVLTLYLLM